MVGYGFNDMGLAFSLALLSRRHTVYPYSTLGFNVTTIYLLISDHFHPPNLAYILLPDTTRLAFAKRAFHHVGDSTNNLER